MRIATLYIILSIYGCLVSCGNHVNDEVDYEKIHHISEIDLSRELLRPDLFCVIDSVIILFDKIPTKDALFFAFNLYTGVEYAKFGVIGSGPFDYNSPVQMSFDKIENKIWTFDRNYSKMYGYNLQDVINNEIDSIFEVKVPKEVSRVVLENDTLGYCLGSFSKHGGMLGKMVNGEIINSYSSFPEIKDDNLTAAQKFELFQGEITINQYNNKIVYTSARCDLIKIFSVQDGIPVEVKTRYSFLPKYRRNNADYLTLLPENPNGYISVSVSDNYILALFSGRSKKEHGDRHYFGDMIHIFDWEGDLIRKVVLDKDAWQITINKSTNKLYTIHFNFDESEEYTKVQYYEYNLEI